MRQNGLERSRVAAGVELDRGSHVRHRRPPPPAPSAFPSSSKERCRCVRARNVTARDERAPLGQSARGSGSRPADRPRRQPRRPSGRPLRVEHALDTADCPQSGAVVQVAESDQAAASSAPSELVSQQLEGGERPCGRCSSSRAIGADRRLPAGRSSAESGRAGSRRAGRALQQAAAAAGQALVPWPPAAPRRRRDVRSPAAWPVDALHAAPQQTLPLAARAAM